MGLLSASLLAALACGGDLVTGRGVGSLAVTGRAERGSVVRVGVRVGVDTAVQPVSNITVSPSDAATVLGNGELRLTRTGSLTIIATAGGASFTTVISVAAPPVIVFDGLAGGNRDVYRVALDGGELVRLTTHSSSDHQPSAVGNTVLFTSFRDGNAELYSVKPDGTNEQRLTATAFSETAGALSPDGGKVAYVTAVSGQLRVWVSAFAPGAATPLTTPARLTDGMFGTTSTSERTPKWAPASDRVVLVSEVPQSSTFALYTTSSVPGSAPARISGSGTTNTELEPSWSFDGFFIAYTVIAGPSTDIYIRDLRTGIATQVTGGTGLRSQPEWLPDGRVVFTTFSRIPGDPSVISWVDPALPLAVHPIVIPGIAAEHAAPVRP